MISVALHHEKLYLPEAALVVLNVNCAESAPLGKSVRTADFWVYRLSYIIVMSPPRNSTSQTSPDIPLVLKYSFLWISPNCLVSYSHSPSHTHLLGEICIFTSFTPASFGPWLDMGQVLIILIN